MNSKNGLRSVVIPNELDKQVLSYCRKFGLSRSEIVRSALIDFLKEKSHEV